MGKKDRTPIPNQLLRRARLERGWTQRGVAERIGAPNDMMVTRWERGTAFPSAYYIERLCQLFEQKASDLGLLRDPHTMDSSQSLEREPDPSDVSEEHASEPVSAPTQESFSPQHVHQQPSFWNLPFPRNMYFTGREELLEHIAATLRTDHLAALGHIQAISGLGGVGKTQIAIEYAYRFRHRYQALLWTYAETYEALVSGFVAIAEVLQLPQKELQEQRVAVQAVKDWLNSHDHWLLIFDNADDLVLLREFLPASGGGHVLFTTRAASTGGLARRIDVASWQQEEGAIFLLRRAGLLADIPEPVPLASEPFLLAQEIAQEMGGLPLALDQAGAYIEETQCRLSTYLQLYRRHRASFLTVRGGLALDHPEPVATTWSLSFEKIEQRNPAAADILRVCTFLQPDAIPEEIFSEGAAHLGSHLEPLAHHPLAYNQAMQALLAYSLVRRNPTHHLFSLHRLVQWVLRASMDESTTRLWVERTIQAVNAVLPEEDYTTWDIYERCLPQAQGCAQLIEQCNVTSLAAARLLYQTGRYLVAQTRSTEAEPLFQRALAIQEQMLGPQHPSAALSLHGLANLSREEGKYEQAETHYQRALHILEQQVEPDPALIATSLHDLAILYRRQRAFAQTEALFERALQLREQSLGAEHPLVAASLNSLAICYDQQGKYGQAEPLFERALHIWEQQVGSQHLVVSKTLNNLGILSEKQGKYEQAESFYQRALRIREQELEPDHPFIAQALYNLGILSEKQGKYAQAELLYQRVVHIFERRQELDQTDQAARLSSLADLYRKQGKYEQAEPLFEQVLAIWKHIPTPETFVAYALALKRVADFYREQGSYEQAEPLYQQAIQIQEQKFGPDHPERAMSLNGLANLYREQGRYEKAEPLYQRAIQIQEQVLPADHPERAVSLTDLADLYRKQGKYEQAEPLYQKAMSLQERKLGPDHPELASTLSGLAALYREQGRGEEAEPLFQKALCLREHALVSGHVLLQETLQGDVSLQRAPGQKEEAERREEREQ